jgi:hypothetical protein
MSTQNRTILSRRRALKTGSLAAIAAGLIGAGSPQATEAAPAPLALAAPIDTAGLQADSYRHQEIVAETFQNLIVAEHAIRGTLSPAQLQVFNTYENALSGHYLTAWDMYVAEIARHLPGFAPAINALWQHIGGPDGIPGECCLPNGNEAVS